MVKILVVFVVAGFGSVSVKADIILNVSNSNPVAGGGVVASTQYLQASWTQATTYSNVSISAWVFGEVNRAPVGTAYLTSTLPGSPTLQDAFVFPLIPADTHASLVPLFSGLTLASGTYFLTLATNDPSGGGWSDALNGGGAPTITLGSGVTLGDLRFSPPQG